MNIHLLAVGEIMVDVVAAVPADGGRHGDVSIHAGGTPINVARAARALGATATVLGRVGNDPAATLVRESLAADDIRAVLASDGERPTGAFVQLGEHIVASRGANVALAAKDVSITTADAVLVSGYVLLNDDTASAGRAALEIDSAWPAVDAGSAALLAEDRRETAFAWLAGARVAFFNEAEATALTEEAPERAAVLLAERFDIVVVKLGSRGALAARGSELIHVPASTDTPVQTTVGAGDALDAGVLVALADGHDLREALAVGVGAAGRWLAGLQADATSPG